MSTPTIELNTVPRAIPRDLQRALTSLIASSKLILLTGAGISTRANIPDFRSHDGLYAQGKGKKKAKDLFSADVFRSPEATEEFFRFTASMQRLTSQAEPTVTHKLAKKLAKTGKLLRCYTQNIDALEVKAGLAYATAVKEGHVVQLHGNVHRVRCACGWQACDDRARERKVAGKRPLSLMRGCGSLRPSIVLYDETYPIELAESIATLSSYDMRQKVDFVLVMGTSLKIPGFKKLVKDFAAVAHERAGSKPQVILVNDADVLLKEWDGVFDCHIKGDCDIFSKLVLDEWKRSKPDVFLQQSILSDVTNMQGGRRPLACKPKAANGVSTKRAIEVDSDATPPRKKPHLIVHLPTPPPSDRSKRTISMRR